jgi:hypothetical protein
MLHAVSGIVLNLLLRKWFPPLISLLASLPFVISPYQMHWFSQINKDSFVTCGAILFTYGILHALKVIIRTPCFRDLAIFVAFTGTGALLIFIARPYLVMILQYLSLLLLLIAFITSTRQKMRDYGHFSLVIKLISIILFFIALNPLTHGASSDQIINRITLTNQDDQNSVKYPTMHRTVPSHTIPSILILLLLTQDQDVHDLDKNPMVHGIIADRTINDFNFSNQVDKKFDKYPIVYECTETTNVGWKRTKIIPQFIDKKIKSLLSVRCSYFKMCYDHNPATRKSVLDADVFPNSFAETLAYLPRATLIGLFSPFPSTWFYRPQGRLSTFYFIVAIENIFFYISFAFLIVWLLKFNRRFHFWGPLALCIGVMIVYGIGVPFIGTLYRQRYPFWMIVYCTGLAALLTLSKQYILKWLDIGIDNQP